jgi:flavin reductase (DIM6/NTAB) family NADH-FMN oxidoreductase RutF
MSKNIKVGTKNQCMRKISLQIENPDIHVERYVWKQCLYAHQVVLISTVDSEDVPNVAPKTWATPCRDDPPLFMFCCTSTHKTGQNVLSTGEFVVNYPGHDLVEKVALAGGSHNPNKIEAVGLTPLPSEKVRPPRIAECYQHLECILEEKKQNGSTGYIFFGKVVAASSDELPEDKNRKIEAANPLIYVHGRYTNICSLNPWKWPVAP